MGLLKGSLVGETWGSVTAPFAVASLVAEHGLSGPQASVVLAPGL